MASDLEIVSFIKEQLASGRDVRTIRDFLIKKGVNSIEVDSAFDIAFGGTGKTDVPTHNASIHKFVVTGLVFLVLLLVIAGYSLYQNIAPGPDIHVDQPDIVKPIYNPPAEQVLDEPETGCENKEADEKYDCYLALIEEEDINCYKIENEVERDYCYRVHDYYILELDSA